MFLRLLIVSFFFILCSYASAQSFDKMNTDLILQMKEYQKEQKLGTIIPVLVKGDLGTIASFVRNTPSGRYKYGVKNIAAIEIKAGELFRMNRFPQIERIEYYRDKAHLLNTIMGENTNVDSVKAGFGALPQGYDGEGVIVGLLDIGLDWKHPDFQNGDGSTRIIHFWDQTIEDSTNLASSYGYGYEWDSVAINNALITHDPEKYGGHGTMVTGIAAGNGMAADTMAGVAPKADIIHVDVFFAENFISNFVDGVNYIVTKASQAGKPVAFNASLGSYFGSHDGRDLATEMIENMLDAQNGRFMTQAAGNAGAVRFHLGHTIDADTSTTFFKYSAVTESVYINLYADKSDFDGVYFSLGQIDNTTFERYGNTGFLNIPELTDFASSNSFETTRDVRDPMGNLLGRFNLYIDFYKDAYDITIIINNLSNNDDYWELRTTGSGRLDSWNGEGALGNSSIIEEIPSASIFPDSIHYKTSDNLKTIIGRWACSPKILTVGAYSNRSQYMDKDTILRNTSVARNNFVNYSSRGPTRTGLAKPDVITPGQNIFAANTLNILNTGNPRNILFTQMHSIAGGTSFAGPIAAGVGALYLQMHPNADYAEVISAFQDYAVVDSFLTATQYGEQFPSPDWGYGKLNAFQALEGNLVYGCTDPSADNYNPNVDIEDNTTCDYSSSIKDPAFVEEFRLQPNPSLGFSNIVYDFDLNNIKNGRFLIVDVLGQTLEEININENAGILSINHERLAKGMYFCILQIDNQFVTNRKLSVIR